MSTYLRRTFSGASTSRKTFTLSFWVKRSTFGSMKAIISAETNNTNNYDQIIFTSGDQFEINNVANGSDVIQYKTSAVFRDPSAWYHVVAAIDTTQASASNGIKIYINGVLQTSLASTTYAQNATFNIGKDGEKTSIGRRERDGDGYGVGYLSEFYYIDGQQKAATDFGQTDSTTGIWKPKTYSGTYGNNGFRLEFKNSGALGTDTSGNSETFTVNNAGTNAQVVDTATNNFVTLNPLQNGYPPTGNVVTLSQGNLTAKETQSAWTPYDSTIAATSGKWYWECKNVSGSPATGVMFGIQSQEGSDITGIFSTDGRYPGYYSSRTGFSYHASGTYYYNGAGTTTGSVTYTTGDIIMFALDMDNGFLYAGKNGTWNNSGNPTSGASGTGNVYNGFSGKPISPCNALNGSTILTSMNFGNPPFTISSGNADGAGHGNFEYAVPSGYYALCTENLNTYG